MNTCRKSLIFSSLIKPITDFKKEADITTFPCFSILAKIHQIILVSKFVAVSFKKFFSVFPSEVYYNSLRPRIILSTYREILRLMPRMAEKRKEIQEKLGGEGQPIEKWFEKFQLKNETVNRYR